LTTEIVSLDDKRQVALLKAIGFDKLAPEQRELALNIAKRYELDPLLRHIVMVDGRPFITRDALLHIAHRSGQFDGIETTLPEIVGDEWRCTATVWRRDMSHPFTYPGRYPVKGRNATYAPEMAIKVAESMALRRAFNVAAPVLEERWDIDTAEVPAERPKVSLAERVSEKAARIAAVETAEAPDEIVVEEEAPLPVEPAPMPEPDMGDMSEIVATALDEPAEMTTAEASRRFKAAVKAAGLSPDAVATAARATWGTVPSTAYGAKHYTGLAAALLIEL